ncbi:MAG: hypothetical protein QM771_08795 [Nitrospira sp.]
MINEMNRPIQEPNVARAVLGTSLSQSASYRGAGASLPLHQPVIEVSESDGNFNVYADFRPVLQNSAMQVSVEFAQQGIILTGGTVERYLPIPTDAFIGHARVTVTGGIARISIPTADSGHRWRSIVMW